MLFFSRFPQNGSVKWPAAAMTMTYVTTLVAKTRSTVTLSLNDVSTKCVRNMRPQLVLQSPKVGLFIWYCTISITKFEHSSHSLETFQSCWSLCQLIECEHTSVCWGCYETEISWNFMWTTFFSMLVCSSPFLIGKNLAVSICNILDLPYWKFLFHFINPVNCL